MKNRPLTSEEARSLRVLFLNFGRGQELAVNRGEHSGWPGPYTVKALDVFMGIARANTVHRETKWPAVPACPRHEFFN
jgi:hypothetical protein